MHKIFFFVAVFFIAGNSCVAQRLSTLERKNLEKKEDSLMPVAAKIIQARNAEDRFAADSEFTRMFVRALQTKNSFL